MEYNHLFVIVAHFQIGYIIYMELQKEKIYSTSEIMDYLLKTNPNQKSASLYNQIKKMEEKGKIARISKSKYVFKNFMLFSYDLTKPTKKVLRLLKSIYSFDFCIYETQEVLNQFLNHLLSTNAIIVEVPKMYMDHVFYTLRDNGFNNVLYNPNKEEVFRYLSDNTIVIAPLSSKAPIIREEHKITIEKLVVDIIVSPLLNCFYEGGEIENIISDITHHYLVKYDTLRTYAKRRYAYDKLIEYVSDLIKEFLRD